jgi:hypothetical protein
VTLALGFGAQSLIKAEFDEEGIAVPRPTPWTAPP